MDYLIQLWEDWNDQWGAGVAGLAALILVIIVLTEKLRGFVSSVRHWKGWIRIGQQYELLRDRYRVHIAKRVMRSKLAELGGVRFPVEAYGRCLSQNPRDSRRDVTGKVVPERPSWLNDYYVATALESLYEKAEIVKAELYGRNGWPSRAERYLFRNRTPGQTVQEETNEIENDSRCMAYQGFFHNCPTGDRYEYKSYAETVSVRETQFGTQVWLKESAPPCLRCWENLYRKRDIKHLVDNITQYDFAEHATSEITGCNSRFQDAVTKVCENNRCPAEVPLIKRAVEEGMAIRRQQIESLDPSAQTEWTEDLTREFTSRLNVWMKGALSSRQG